ncbi:MAG TPA: VWA domain-containing protein [Pyrinomonadaceae bacterium]|nr:VWA domain-containing protein [Pyrinomonadaceae bacterium]
MKIGRLLFLLCLAAAAAHAQPGAPAPRQTPTPRPAQDAPQQEQGRAEVITIREVRVPVTVVDKKGVPVTGLLKSDFQVFEDKVPQDFQFIGELKELQRLPVYVAVLMDTSYSTAGKLKFEQEAALNFLHTVTRLRKDRAAFVTFDDEVRLRQDFTTNLDLLSNAVNAVKKPGLHTALYDAVWQFCDEKMRDIGGGGRRVVVLITDGEDTYSRVTLREAIEIAQQTDTIIFSLSTKGGFTGSSVPGVEAGTVKDTGDKNLEKLAEETGGRAFFTGDMLALERAFKRIGEELRSQYILSYVPTNKAFDGSRRDIDVKLANKKDGWRVRAKRGYRATRDLVAP